MDDLSKYRRLWSAVLLQQIIDARIKGNKNSDKVNKYNAINYLRSNSKDLQTVFWYAGLDPIYAKFLSEVAFESIPAELFRLVTKVRNKRK